MMKIKKLGLIITLIFALFGTACEQTQPVQNDKETKSVKEAKETKKSVADKKALPTTKTPVQETKETSTKKDKEKISKDDKKISKDKEKVSIDDDYKPVSLNEIPDYSGDAYVEVNDNKPGFSASDKKLTKAFEFYSDLDYLGRCGQAYANICPQIQPTATRGPIGQVRPSGWHTVKYNDLIDGNYLYNRCHLIGYQLSGENANEKNLITGTRYLNVVGMLEFENKVDDYVDSTGNHVLYRVTPIYDGDNLVASGVQMEGWSVEDNGSGICFNVYCYNVQPGIYIDYSNGDSHETGTSSKSDKKEMTYVLNKNTKKFHLPGCSSVNQMAEHNKQVYSGTRDEVIDMGYTPCQRCNP